MMCDRTAIEAVNYPTASPKTNSSVADSVVGAVMDAVSIRQLMGDLRSYETTIQLAVETLTERRLEGVQVERHLARIYEAIARSNEILSQIATQYGG